MVSIQTGWEKTWRLTQVATLRSKAQTLGALIQRITPWARIQSFDSGCEGAGR